VLVSVIDLVMVPTVVRRSVLLVRSTSCFSLILLCLLSSANVSCNYTMTCYIHGTVCQMTVINNYQHK